MLFVVSMIAMLIASCSAAQRQHAKEIVRVVDAACVVIPVFVDNNILEEVCATERDLSPIIADILRHRRQLKSAGAPAEGGTVCVNMPAPTAFGPAPPKE